MENSTCPKCGKTIECVKAWIGTPPPGWTPGEQAPHVCPPRDYIFDGGEEVASLLIEADALESKARLLRDKAHEKMFAEAVADEREACANLVDAMASMQADAKEIAAAIRTRGGN